MSYIKKVPLLIQRSNYSSGVGGFWDDEGTGDGGAATTVVPAQSQPAGGGGFDPWKSIAAFFGGAAAPPQPVYAAPAPNPLATIMPIALVGGGLLLFLALRK